MILFRSILTTVEFELSRFMTPQRILLAVVMALFPPMMIWILSGTGLLLFTEVAICVFCGMTCLLSLLLWATPNVHAELEGKSWTFVTTRPWGRWSILFGKFLVAVGWSFAISWIALSLCMLIVDSGQLITLVEAPHPGTVEVEKAAGSFHSPPGMEEGSVRALTRVELWLYLSILLFLASCVYAAIFSFLGVITQRRAMVVAVGYFLVIEILVAIVPAVVGKLAMSYHMLCLLLHWIGWILPDTEGPGSGMREFRNLYGLYPVWMHLLAIITMTAVTLTLSAIIIRWREYITLEDAQA